MLLNDFLNSENPYVEKFFRKLIVSYLIVLNLNSQGASILH